MDPITDWDVIIRQRVDKFIATDRWEVLTPKLEKAFGDSELKVGILRFIVLWSLTYYVFSGIDILDSAIEDILTNEADPKFDTVDLKRRLTSDKYLSIHEQYRQTFLNITESIWNIIANYNNANSFDKQLKFNTITQAKKLENIQNVLRTFALATIHRHIVNIWYPVQLMLHMSVPSNDDNDQVSIILEAAIEAQKKLIDETDSRLQAAKAELAAAKANSSDSASDDTAVATTKFMEKLKAMEKLQNSISILDSAASGFRDRRREAIIEQLNKEHEQDEASLAVVNSALEIVEKENNIQKASFVIYEAKDKLLEDMNKLVQTIPDEATNKEKLSSILTAATNLHNAQKDADTAKYATALILQFAGKEDTCSTDKGMQTIICRLRQVTDSLKLAREALDAASGTNTFEEREAPTLAEGAEGVVGTDTKEIITAEAPQGAEANLAKKFESELGEPTHPKEPKAAQIVLDAAHDIEKNRQQTDGAGFIPLSHADILNRVLGGSGIPAPAPAAASVPAWKADGGALALTSFASSLTSRRIPLNIKTRFIAFSVLGAILAFLPTKWLLEAERVVSPVSAAMAFISLYILFWIAVALRFPFADMQGAWILVHIGTLYFISMLAARMGPAAQEPRAVPVAERVERLTVKTFTSWLIAVAAVAFV